MRRRKTRKPWRSAMRWLVIVWLIAVAGISVTGMRLPYRKADVAVVFGNALYDDGTPKPILAARLDAALRCHRDGRCPVLFLSGSVDGPGLDEARAMRRYLVEHGVDELAIVVDDRGDNTLASARNAVAYMRAHDMSSVMLVSQFHHLARARLAFKHAGAKRIYGTYPRVFRLIDLYSIWREVPAYVVYLVRLGINSDASPVSFRPMVFLWKLVKCVS